MAEVCSTEAMPRPMNAKRKQNAQNLVDDGGANAWGNANSRGWVDNLTQAEIEAMDSYMTSPEVNFLLRGGSQADMLELTSDEFAQQLALMDSAMAKASVTGNDIVTWRGCSADVFDDLPTGSIFADDAFVSTSLLKRNAQVFVDQASDLEDLGIEDARGIMCRILIPKGSKGAYLGNIDSNFAGQQELLLPRGSRFRVLLKTNDTIFLELIP